MFKKHKVQCVILAGGQGRRLDGKGKYSQPLRNKSLLEHVYSRMLIQTDYVAVNFREEKFKENFGFPVVTDKFKDNVGPLAGIHAAISYSKEKSNQNLSSVVTVPVDTPFIPLNLIERFAKNFNQITTEVVIAYSENRHHPTIAMWNTSIINKLEESILINIRKIDIFTSKLKKVFVKWEHDSYDPFFNINDLNDLKLAENMIKKNMIK